MIHRLAAVARNRFHERRADLFIRLIRPTPGMRVLDLGSGSGDPFVARIARRVPLDVTLADISEGPLEDAARLGYHGVQVKEGEPLPFSPGEFDVVVSNSVIEHVTLLKEECSSPAITDQDWVRRSLASQRAFAAEVRRVGRGYFVQTPHRDFPLDLHLWLPFTNWLSHSGVRGLIKYTDRYWVKTAIPDWNLLGTSDMQALFPDGRVHVESLGPLPKSLIAYRPPGTA